MTEEKRRALIEKHSEINVECNDWWEDLYDVWKEKLQGIGVHNPEITFSGFWSQGDGASFTGSLDEQAFMKTHPELQTEFPAFWWILERAEADGCGEILRRTSSYCHENTVAYDLDDRSWENPYGEERDPVRHHVYQAWDVKRRAEEARFIERVNEVLRDYMCQIYDELEAEYEHLTSDEAVWEAIEANDLDVDDEDEDDTLTLAA